mmetsp:Transcript_728/g.2160  ORF Transcript_728/g.2160 Transcript_728/m.2160 type:complete len:215 (+) Transcript_728:444-1088(+)
MQAGLCPHCMRGTVGLPCAGQHLSPSFQLWLSIRVHLRTKQQKTPIRDHRWNRAALMGTCRIRRQLQLSGNAARAASLLQPGQLRQGLRQPPNQRVPERNLSPVVQRVQQCAMAPQLLPLATLRWMRKSNRQDGSPSGCMRSGIATPSEQAAAPLMEMAVRTAALFPLLPLRKAAAMSREQPAGMPAVTVAMAIELSAVAPLTRSTAYMPPLVP